jgi:hypothetical protein
VAFRAAGSPAEGVLVMRGAADQAGPDPAMAWGRHCGRRDVSFVLTAIFSSCSRSR